MSNKSYKNYKEEALENNSELRSEYAALEAQYAFIEAVIAARIEQNLTQADIAKRMKTSQSNISRFERGNCNPSVEFLQKLATALDKKLQIKLQ